MQNEIKKIEKNTLNMQNMPNIKIGDTVRHFKGNLYLVLNLAEHTENGDYMIIYKALGTGKVYARPFEMFMSKIEEGREDKFNQKYRFVSVEPESQA